MSLDDDFFWIALFWPFTSWRGFVVLAAIGGLVIWWAASQDADCAERRCDRGKPAIIGGRCLCVVEPTTGEKR